MEKQKLPNATAVLVLGILSIPTCCCYGAGLILGIIALVLANKDMALYKQSPELYSNYSALNTGKILAYVGIALSIVSIVMMVVGNTMFSPEEIQNWAKEMQAKQ